MSIASEFQNLEGRENAGLCGVFGFEADAEATFAQFVYELPLAIGGYIARAESVGNFRGGARGGGWWVGWSGVKV